MAHGLYFIQGCPTCGRRVQVRMEYLGKYVTCHHCGAAFLADASDKQSEAAAGNGHLNGSLTPVRISAFRWKASQTVSWPFGPEHESV